MDNEKEIIEKIKRIEALFQGTNVEGEKNAAGLALNRLQKRLDDIKREDPPVEYKFSLSDTWSRKLFMALLRKYKIEPYRYSRQKHTTVMARVSKTFVDDILWREFEELNGVLVSYLEEVSDRVIKESLGVETKDADVVNKPKMLN